MARTKFTTTTTGTGVLTVSAAAGFNDGTFNNSLRSQTHGTAASSRTPYIIIDGNGTSWEWGFCSISGSALTREVILDSSNSGSVVSLSGSTPHTVVFPEGGLLNRCATVVYEKASQSVSAGGTVFGVEFDTLKTDGASAGSLPSESVPAVPMFMDNVHTFMPYAKGYQIHLYAETLTAQSGYINLYMTDNGNGQAWNTFASTWIPTDMINNKGTLMGPYIEFQSPITGQSNFFPTTCSVNLKNTGAGSINVKVRAIVTYYF